MLEMRAKHDTSMMILNSNWIIPGLSLVKKICLCQEADTRDCFFDTRNSPFLADFVCRSRILVCRASTQTKIFLFVLHLCPAKGTKKTVFSFFRINYLICHVCVAAKDQPKADPYGKQNLQTKTKVAASFVFTSPYVGNFHHKTCCKFCGTGLLP